MVTRTNLVIVGPTGSPSLSNQTTSSNSNDGPAASKTAVAALVSGLVLAIAVAVGAIFVWNRISRRRRDNEKPTDNVDEPESQEPRQHPNPQLDTINLNSEDLEDVEVNVDTEILRQVISEAISVLDRTEKEPRPPPYANRLPIPQDNPPEYVQEHL
ncbi:hypothetical protein HDU97_001794 [Phlyctochytrium planicorne]|nr:hypothetical protein HDU97_001794 [Phlyctochytrium planicorne]